MGRVNEHGQTQRPRENLCIYDSKISAKDKDETRRSRQETKRQTQGINHKTNEGVLATNK